MIMSLSEHDLKNYVIKQLNNFFPDNIQYDTNHLYKSLDMALMRFEYCSKHVALLGFKKDGVPCFNHLHTDQYAMFLYLFSNTIWNEYKDEVIATKIMYLNKALHSLNCMYNTKLPEIFLFIHCVGTVIGKATYGNYIVIYQGVTIGTHNEQEPILGDYVSLLPNTAVIGKCNIGNRVSIGIGTKLYNTEVPDSHIAITNKNGQIVIKKSENLYSKSVFII